LPYQWLICTFQKQPIPSLENLLTPPLESDIKKPTLSTPKSSSKASVAAVVVPLIASTETSVTPRQRPKACQLNPVSTNHFTIGLPPSPSPRNILASSPTDSQQQQQHFKAPSKTPENFNAQFEVDFTNIDNPAPAVVTPQAAAPPTAAAVQKIREDKENFDNLFKSNLYPDPFGEHDDEIVEIQSTYADTQMKASEKLFEASIEEHQQQQHQQQVAKVNQHRRYMSDTSGFKRWAFGLCVLWAFVLSWDSTEINRMLAQDIRYRAATWYQPTIEKTQQKQFHDGIHLKTLRRSGLCVCNRLTWKVNLSQEPNRWNDWNIMPLSRKILSKHHLVFGSSERWKRTEAWKWTETKFVFKKTTMTTMKRDFYAMLTKQQEPRYWLLIMTKFA